MLVFVFILIGLVSLGGLIWANTKEGRHDSLIFVCLSAGILSAVALLVNLIAWVSLMGDTADIEAFYNNNIGLYQTTITDTQTVLTVTQNTDNVTIPVQGSIEKVGVGSMTAERIKDLRDAATKYNAIIPQRQGQICTWYDKIITWIGGGSSLQFQLYL